MFLLYVISYGKPEFLPIVTYVVSQFPLSKEFNTVF